MYEVHMTAKATESLDAITDAKTRAKIRRKIERLQDSPNQQGVPLRDELQGLRRIVAASRYRVIFRVDDYCQERRAETGSEGEVGVVFVGIRKDGDKKNIYAIAKKLMDRGELD